MVIMEPLRDFAALLHQTGCISREQYDELAGKLEDLERGSVLLGDLSRAHDRQIGRVGRGRDIEGEQ